jgi:hypothetical protein
VRATLEVARLTLEAGEHKANELAARRLAELLESQEIRESLQAWRARTVSS